MVRLLPRTVAWDSTQMRRSPLASYLHGPGQVYVAPVVVVPDCDWFAKSSWNALLSAPPLSRMRVVHVVAAAVSTFEAFDITSAGTGHNDDDDVLAQSVAGWATVGQRWASLKPCAYRTASPRFRPDSKARC